MYNAHNRPVQHINKYILTTTTRRPALAQFHRYTLRIKDEKTPLPAGTAALASEIDNFFLDKPLNLRLPTPKVGSATTKNTTTDSCKIRQANSPIPTISTERKATKISLWFGL